MTLFAGTSTGKAVSDRQRRKLDIVQQWPSRQSDHRTRDPDRRPEDHLRGPQWGGRVLQTTTAATGGAGQYRPPRSTWPLWPSTPLRVRSTLYAATLGRGMHDFKIVPGTAPPFFLQSPAGPYPFEASTSAIRSSPPA